MYRVYCDFDETITMGDVGSQILAQFGTSLAFEIWKDFDLGIKTPAECLRIACSTISNISKSGVQKIIETQTLRAGFSEFVEFCRSRSIPVTIVSDGFSLYIRRIFSDHGLSHIPIWTNTIELNEQGLLDLTFEHEREGCKHCASCKCAGVITTSDDTDTIVYIGDGYSDWCPSSLSDVVFATRDLKRQCGELGIPHHPFNDFFEVRAILENYLQDRPKYRREQAHRRRKEIIAIE